MDNKPEPLYKRLRQYFDIKITKKVNPSNGSDNIITTDKGYAALPVTFNFDWQQAVGWIDISKKAADQIISNTLVLTPAYEDDKLIGFGIIPAASASPEKPQAPQQKRTAGFFWYLFLVSVIAGLLAIIGLIIRLFYVHAG